jgi:hypothetical protein
MKTSMALGALWLSRSFPRLNEQVVQAIALDQTPDFVQEDEKLTCLCVPALG